VKPYEERDVAFRPIVVTAVFLAGLIVFSGGLMWVLDRVLVSRHAARSAPFPLVEADRRREPPTPRLQEKPRRDLTTLRARDQALLESYGWVDRGAGRVRVPVARAMELLATEAER
jgi:hypothetical protein